MRILFRSYFEITIRTGAGWRVVISEKAITSLAYSCRIAGGTVIGTFCTFPINDISVPYFTDTSP
jgi:hypothetical protein